MNLNKGKQVLLTLAVIQTIYSIIFMNSQVQNINAIFLYLQPVFIQEVECYMKLLPWHTFVFLDKLLNFVICKIVTLDRLLKFPDFSLVK